MNGGGLGKSGEKNSTATRVGKKKLNSTTEKNSTAGWPGKKYRYSNTLNEVSDFIR